MGWFRDPIDRAFGLLGYIRADLVNEREAIEDSRPGEEIETEAPGEAEPGGAVRWYVRHITGNENKWLNGKSDLAGDLAREQFTAVDDEAISVYLASSAVEEAEAIAALQNLRGKEKDAVALRVYEEDIRRAGLLVKAEEHGQTGVLEVDLRHRDLVGKAEAYVLVARAALEGQLQGEERVRSVRPNVVLRFWETFVDLDDSLMSANARKKCQDKLKGKKSSRG